MKRSKWSRWVALLSLTGSLAACGGGGEAGGTGRHELSVAVSGSGHVSSQPDGIDCGNRCRASFAEGTAVTLTAAPAAGQRLSSWGGACGGGGATCVVSMSAARSVTVTFVGSGSVPSYTLGGTLSGLSTGTTVVLRNNGTNDLSRSANGSFQFSQQVDQGTTYSVSIATQPSGQTCSVANGSGTMQAAVNNVQVSCVAALAGWQPAVNLSDVGATSPHIAMDDQGNGLAVWGQLDAGGANHSLWYSHYNQAADQWSTPALVENLPGNSGRAVGEAHLAMHRATGRAVLAWLQTDGGTISVWARDFDPAAGWGTVTNLESVHGMAGWLSAGIDASGNAMVAWSQMTPRWSIWANRFVRAAGWGTAQLLETNNTVGGVDGDPALAMSDNGQVLVAWKAALHNDAINGLWTNRFTPATGWATAERRIASPAGGPARSRPAVAADAQGRAILAWGQIDTDATGSWHGIQTLRFDSGWTASPVLVGMRQTVRSTVAIPVLAMGPGGAAVVSWGMGETDTLQASVAPAGAAFGVVTVLSSGAAVGSIESLPAVVVNDAGTVMVGWRRSGTRGSAIHVQRYASGAGWQLDTVASDVSPSESVWGFHAGLGLNASGQALVGWNVLMFSGSVARARRYVAIP